MTIKHLQEADFVVNFPGAVGFWPDERLSGLVGRFLLNNIHTHHADADEIPAGDKNSSENNK